jgi:serine/threonine protein kinase
VGDLLGEGGQGSVFELRSDDPAAPVLALKWYRPETSHPEQRRALTRLAQQPPPSEAFLWPLEVIERPGGDFGYVMPLRPAGFVPISDLLTGRVDASFSTVAKLCMGLADTFLKLHAQGLCYRDISLGNVFFEVGTGRPLVCDNDNVGVDGEGEARVLGTSRFMAPEVVRDEAQPSINTDLYSLAVLNFYLLMFHHPLQGRLELDYPCLDRDAERRLFGEDPHFIFDPADDSNRPDPTIHGAVLQYWPMYPQYIRDDFTTAFTVGLTEPGRRVREGVWRAHLSRLLDGIVVCSACQRENLTDDGRLLSPCWSCGADLPTPVRLRIGHRPLVLNPGTLVTRHHLFRDYDYDTVVADVVQHPRRPGLWGLRNRSAGTWQVTGPDGEVHEVGTGRSTGLAPGASVDFGRVTGVIEV